MTSKLYTDNQLDFERVFEIRILDLRKRGGIKQRSFSLHAKKGTKDDEYVTVDQLKKSLETYLEKYNKEEV